MLEQTFRWSLRIWPMDSKQSNKPSTATHSPCHITLRLISCFVSFGFFLLFFFSVLLLSEWFFVFSIHTDKPNYVHLVCFCVCPNTITVASYRTTSCKEPIEEEEEVEKKKNMKEAHKNAVAIIYGTSFRKQIGWNKQTHRHLPTLLLHDRTGCKNTKKKKERENEENIEINQFISAHTRNGNITETHHHDHWWKYRCSSEANKREWKWMRALFQSRSGDPLIQIVFCVNWKAFYCILVNGCRLCVEWDLPTFRFDSGV